MGLPELDFHLRHIGLIVGSFNLNSVSVEGQILNGGLNKVGNLLSILIGGVRHL